MKLTMKIVTTILALAATAAGAQGRQDHQRFDFGPAEPEQYPAGWICDFDYEIADLGGWVVRNRFYDADGNRIRAMLIGEANIRHTNLETGETLVERYHHAIHRDFVDGEETFTGNFWHLRDEAGKIVLVGAGQQVWDLRTFELVDATPAAHAAFAETICPALGGAPAP
jgi:hypothetical protein